MGEAFIDYRRTPLIFSIFQLLPHRFLVCSISKFSSDVTWLVSLLACLGIHLFAVMFGIFPFSVRMFEFAAHTGPRRYSIDRACECWRIYATPLHC